PDGGGSEEEALVRDQLDVLAPDAAYPTVRSAPHRAGQERRAAELLRREPGQEVRRQRSDVVDCVVDLLRVRLGKPKHDAAIALGGDGGDPVEHAGEARGDRRVPRAREGE